jgi:nucleoside-diphosphate-sugar epimerase
MKKKIVDQPPVFSVFGSSGFIGSRFCGKYPNVIKIERNSRLPQSENILYFISTVNNYAVLNDDLHKDIETNLNILMDVLINCKNNNLTFNFISSWFVYGDCKLPASEETFCNPKGFYSITKRCAEQLLISFCKTFNINFRILRLCSVYGFGDKKVSKKKNAIQYMIEEIKQNRDINLYENGEPIRDMMHVDDVCDAIHLIITKSPVNQIYNIGSGSPTKICDVMEISKSILNSQSKINSIDTPKFHKIVAPRDFYMKIDKLTSLGFKQKISLDKGISQLCH